MKLTIPIIGIITAVFLSSGCIPKNVNIDPHDSIAGTITEKPLVQEKKKSTPSPKTSESIIMVPQSDVEETLKNLNIKFPTDEAQGILVNDNTMLMQVTGSSTCRPTPLNAIDHDGTLFITMKKWDDMCTMDMRKFLWRIKLPESMNPSKKSPPIIINYMKAGNAKPSQIF